MSKPDKFLLSPALTVCDVVVIPWGKQEFIHVCRVVLLQSHPHGAENHVGDLVLPKCELHVVPGVRVGRSELKQLLCFVLLLSKHRLLLFGQMWRVMLLPS